MSDVRLNIRDTNEAIHGTIHGSVADAVVAALSAEPETIAELEAALQRFIKQVDDYRPFDSFHAGPKEEAWDAGIVVVDLAARIVVAESSYSAPQSQGELHYHDGTKATDVSLFYRVPDDWLFIYSLDEYRSARDKRGAQRAAATPLAVRRVLYGPAMIEFIVTECFAARVAQTSLCGGAGSAETSVLQTVSGTMGSSSQGGTENDSAIGSLMSDRGVGDYWNPECEIGIPQLAGPKTEDPIAEIHARWLMTPRADLRGQTPREVMLAKLSFIDFDLNTREFQWSLLGEGPPPLARDSFAYRFAGFGTHECVIYYYLMRHLLNECWRRVQREEPGDVAAQSSRLNNVREAWLNSPQGDLDGRIPGAIIESERRRIPLVMSAKSMMIDENCEWCQLLARESDEELGPAFWHLDGCNMDEGFVFSFHRTREEWEEEERRHKEFAEEFNREWAEKHGTGDVA